MSYIEYSYSERYAEAINRGLLPLSKAEKVLGINYKLLFLFADEWHHSSKNYNKTVMVSQFKFSKPLLEALHRFTKENKDFLSKFSNKTCARYGTLNEEYSDFLIENRDDEVPEFVDYSKFENSIKEEILSTFDEKESDKYILIPNIGTLGRKKYPLNLLIIENEIGVSFCKTLRSKCLEIYYYNNKEINENEISQITESISQKFNLIKMEIYNKIMEILVK